MSDDAAMRVWKNMKALRQVADTYDKDVKEAQESLKDDKFEEMQCKLQECQQLEQKHADEATNTPRTIQPSSLRSMSTSSIRSRRPRSTSRNLPTRR